MRGAFLSLSTSASTSYGLRGQSVDPFPLILASFPADPSTSSPMPFPFARPDETRNRRADLFKHPLLPFIHTTFLRPLCLLYTLARATAFFSLFLFFSPLFLSFFLSFFLRVVQKPDNDGGTLCKMFNVPPFHLSSSLPSEVSDLSAILFFSAHFSQSFVFLQLILHLRNFVSCLLLLITRIVTY